MDEFQSEKEQIDEIRQWWKENGNFVVTGLVLGVVVLGGWNYWKHYRLRQAETASAAYEQLIQSVQSGDSASAEDIAGRLTSEFGATPYAAQARLALARLYVATNDADAAATQLQAVIDESDDRHLERIARLRLARVRLMQEQPDDALAVLGSGDAGQFTALFHEVRGDAHALRGDATAARREYEAALADTGAALVDRAFVEMKIADLAADEPDA